MTVVKTNIIPSNCMAFRVCPKNIILINTVTSLRVVITKGTICWRNNFIIQKTTIWPIDPNDESMNMWSAHKGCAQKNVKISKK